MKIGEAFGGTYLKNTHFEDGDHIYTISAIEQKDVGTEENPEVKPVLSFAETDMCLVLNRTNANTIEDVLGSDETDDWIGKKITLGRSKVAFKGERVWAIRVRDVALQASVIDPKEAAKAAVAAFKAAAAKHGDKYPTGTGDEIRASVKMVLDWNSTGEPKTADIQKAAAVLLNEDPAFDPFDNE